MAEERTGRCQRRREKVLLQAEGGPFPTTSEPCVSCKPLRLIDLPSPSIFPTEGSLSDAKILILRRFCFIGKPKVQPLC